MTEDQLIDWARVNRDHWAKVNTSIGASDTDTLEDLSEVAPEDYEEKVHDLTTADSLKPMEVTKLFKLIN